MAVSYNKLWNLVRQNKMKKGDLAKAAQITSRSMSKLNHDEPVQMEVMIRLSPYSQAEKVLKLADENQVFTNQDVQAFLQINADCTNVLLSGMQKKALLPG